VEGLAPRFPRQFASYRLCIAALQVHTPSSLSHAKVSTICLCISLSFPRRDYVLILNIHDRNRPTWPFLPFQNLLSRVVVANSMIKRGQDRKDVNLAGQLDGVDKPSRAFFISSVPYHIDLRLGDKCWKADVSLRSKRYGISYLVPKRRKGAAIVSGMASWSLR